MRIFFVLFMVFTSIGAFGKIDVFVTIDPQAWLVQRIGNQFVDIHVLVKPGSSPATFTPTPRQMIAILKSKIYFKVDAFFENILLEKLSSMKMSPIIVNTADGVKKRIMRTHHVHGHEKKVRHDEMDPHIWLSCKNLIVMGKNIRDALVDIDVENKNKYIKNFRILEKELEILDKNVSKLLLKHKNKKVYVFHPAFGYFLDAYNLKQIAVESGGKTPTPGNIMKIIKDAKKDNIRTIFVQPQFDKKAAKTIAVAIGGKLLVLDPLKGDVSRNIFEMGQIINRVLEKK